MLNTQSQGKIIQPDDKSYPVAAGPPSPTPEEWIKINLSHRRAFMNEAAPKIAPLQDAIELDIATEDEKQRFKAWKLYRVKLNHIEQHRHTNRNSIP